MSSTEPVSDWPEFGKPHPENVLSQIQTNNPYTKPLTPACPCPDPGALCFSKCNESIKQHNLNCRAALKLYIQYLKEQGCQVGSCTIKDKKGCGKTLCKTQTCPIKAPTKETTRGVRSSVRSGAKYSRRR